MQSSAHGRGRRCQRTQKDHHLERGRRIHCQDYPVVGEYLYERMLSSSLNFLLQLTTSKVPT